MACTEQKAQPIFFEEENPRLLSAWGSVDISGGQLVLGAGVTPYALNTPLFTDYAHKLRTIWSAGGIATVPEEGVLEFPVGTVITKTFYYPKDGGDVLKTDDREAVNQQEGLDLNAHRLIETRLLVHRRDGWHPISYVWNEDQTDAVLKRAGAVIPLTLNDKSSQHDFAYIVPNESQCAACHAANATTKVITPLGPTGGQLDRAYNYAGGHENQLSYLVRTGRIRDPEDPYTALPSWADDSIDLDQRARAYLAANCAHCHNPQGPADTSGLDLTTSAEGPRIGLCKPPIAAGSGTGGRRFGIVPGSAEDSIIIYRVESTDPGAMMPELGRALVHEEGAALLRDWIDEMEQGCS